MSNFDRKALYDRMSYGYADTYSEASCVGIFGDEYGRFSSVVRTELPSAFGISLPEDFQGEFASVFTGIHSGGHSCISTTLSSMCGFAIPSDVLTFRGIRAYLPELIVSRLTAVVASKLVFVEFSTTGSEVERHVMVVPSEWCVVEGQRWFPDKRTQVVVMVRSFRDALECNDDEWRSRKLCSSKLVHNKDCGSCGGLKRGDKVFCARCNCFVVGSGHESRCVLPSSDANRHYPAQLGDVYHRLDVLTALGALKVPDKIRSVKADQYLVADAQAKWILARIPGVGDVKAAATYFEAHYLEYRKAYLKDFFPEVPVSAYPFFSYGYMGHVVADTFPSLKAALRTTERKTKLVEYLGFVYDMQPTSDSVGAIEEVRVVVRGAMKALELYCRTDMIDSRVKIEAQLEAKLVQLGKSYKRVKFDDKAAL